MTANPRIQPVLDWFHRNGYPERITLQCLAEGRFRLLLHKAYMPVLDNRQLVMLWHEVLVGYLPESVEAGGTQLELVRAEPLDKTVGVILADFPQTVESQPASDAKTVGRKRRAG